MKLPLWVKDGIGKWEIFPIHLMETFHDGRQGFWYVKIFGGGFENPYWIAWKKYGYDGLRVLEVDDDSTRRRILIKI